MSLSTRSLGGTYQLRVSTIVVDTVGFIVRNFGIYLLMYIPCKLVQHWLNDISNLAMYNHYRLL